MMISERNRQKGTNHGYTYGERVFARLQPVRAFFSPNSQSKTGLYQLARGDV